MNENMLTPPPWYREFWVWVIIGMPAAVIVGCLITVVIAFVNADEVVDESWNNDPIAIHQQLEKVQKAQIAKLGAHIGISRKNGTVSIQLHQAKMKNSSKNTLSTSDDETLILKLEHPTIRQYDEEIIVHKTSAGDYQGKMTLFFSGRRYVSLSPKKGTWLLKGKIKLFTDTNQLIGSN
jgi:hypothetical protein